MGILAQETEHCRLPPEAEVETETEIRRRFRHVNRNARVPFAPGKWIPAVCIQNVIYPKVCEQLGWPPRPWMGKNGVAVYLAKQSPQPPKYLRVKLAGEVHNFQHYYIPGLQTATVSRIEPYPGSHQW
jgi:hypothetical protein